MKKHNFLKKVISSVAALAMMSSLWTGTVMADVDLSKITVESISNGQLASSIVSDLGLTSGVTWVSSNPNVITNDGKVTRPDYDNTAVTLTASAAGQDDKTFEVTVLAKSTDVLAQADFNYPAGVDSTENTLAALTSAAGLQGFVVSAAETGETTSVKSADGNSFMALDFNTRKYGPSIALDTSADELYISFDIGLDNTDVAANYNYNIKIGLESNGTVTNTNILGIRPVDCILTGPANQNVGGWTSNIKSTSGTVRSACVKIDLKNGKIRFGNTADKLIATEYDLGMSKTTNSDLKVVSFQIAKSSPTRATGVMYFDNFLVTAPAEIKHSVALSDLTVESFANGQIASSIVSDLVFPEIAGVTFSSSNPNAITDDGKVTRHDANDVPVTITATDGVTTKTFDVVVLANSTGVLSQSDFYYPSGVDSTERTTAALSGTGINGWTMESTTGETTMVKKDAASGNQFMAFDFNTSGKSPSVALNSSADELYFSFKVGLDNTDVEADYNYNFKIGLESNGTVTNTNILGIRPKSGILTGPGNQNVGGWTSNIVSNTGLTVRDACVKVDLKNGKIRFGNTADKLITTEYDLGMSKTTNSDLKVVSFKIVKSSPTRATGIMYFDDFKVTTPVKVISLATLTAESMTDEIPTHITKDLTVSSDYSWTTSDPTVITADGKVLRDATVAKTATLTAALGAKTKSFKFTVLPTTATSIYQETFNYPALEGQSFTTATAHAAGTWSLGWANPVSKISKIVDAAGDPNYVLDKAGNTTERTVYSLPETAQTGRTVISYDTYMNLEEAASAIYDTFIYFSDYAESGEKQVSMRYYLAGPSTSWPNGVGDISINNAAKKASYHSADSFHIKKEWVNIKIVIDVINDTASVYVNDMVAANNLDLGLDDPTATIKHISFRPGSQGTAGHRYIDNLYIGSESNVFDITSATFADGKISFKYDNTTQADSSSAKAFAVAYDSNDKMLRMSPVQAVSAKGLNNTGELTISADGAKYLKVFVWDTFGAMNTFTASTTVSVPVAAEPAPAE